MCAGGDPYRPRPRPRHRHRRRRRRRRRQHPRHQPRRMCRTTSPPPLPQTPSPPQTRPPSRRMRQAARSPGTTAPYRQTRASTHSRRARARSAGAPWSAGPPTPRQRRASQTRRGGCPRPLRAGALQPTPRARNHPRARHTTQIRICIRESRTQARALRFSFGRKSVFRGRSTGIRMRCRARGVFGTCT